MSDVAWHEMVGMEANVRTRMQGLDAKDERVLRLIDLLPLPAGLLLLGDQLGETETDLRAERRNMYADGLKRGDELIATGAVVDWSPKFIAWIKKELGRDSDPEILLAIIDLKMVADRINKVRSMGRS